MTLSVAIQSVRKRIPRAAQSITTPGSISSPITGWNTRDALDKMAPTDAVTLDNWFPNEGGLYVRGGSATYASGMGSGNVETLATFTGGATQKLLAAANLNIYDISAAGAGTSLASGFANNRWQSANFNGTLQLVNGADTPQKYDGSTIASAGWSGSGLTVTNLVGVITFKSRLWFWENASQNLWYGGTNAITGTLTKFPLGTVAQSGGNVVCLNTMSNDGGDGPNDYLIIALSTGETLFYGGIDPTAQATFALVGRYQMAPPINIRAIVRYGGDCYLTTRNDHTQMSTILAALASGQPPPPSKATGAVQAAVAANAAGFGWQAVFFGDGHKILFNIPNSDGTFSQHVFSTTQRAWCRFQNWNASCFGVYNNKLYYGTSGGLVNQADTGNADIGGVGIAADGQQAWTPLAATLQNSFNPAYRKRVAAIRPIINAVGPITFGFGVGFDYQEPITPTPASSTPTGSPWDTSPWDTSPWSAENQIDVHWRSSGGSGQNIGLRLKCTAVQQIIWLRTDFRVELGKNL